MTEIPEHLSKRVQDARKRASGAYSEGQSTPSHLSNSPTEVPDYLLERSRNARKKSE